MMIGRCTNENDKRWLQYGGRGITVCEAWRKFENFDKDMGPRPEGLSLERIDTNGNYEPGNCRWASQKDQQNNRTNNYRITFNGVTRTCAEWADAIQIPRGTLWARIRSANWSLERAFTEPVGKYFKHTPR